MNNKFFDPQFFREENVGKRVVVGMSGGVDSSVAALILKLQGYEVIGLFMKNWEENDEFGVCEASKEFKDVERVSESLEIPYHSIEFVKEYRDDVFSHFLREYEMGHTPNPDILCNREIKFKLFFNEAMKVGADYLATGHYAQSVFCDGRYELHKGSDPGKDQSYFVYTIKGERLPKVLYPVGNIIKNDVRELARKYELSTSEKKDSTGICFIGERNFRNFLSNYIKKSVGEFKLLNGTTVGEHMGIPYYTIGQRKGLGLGGAGDPWFVVGKDLLKNIIYVERGERHPALFSDDLTATEISWVNDDYMRSQPLPFHCKAKIRYRQADQDCTITKIEGDRLFVTFKEPQRAITPRQSIVFYQGENCLGGAMIEKSGPTYFDLKKPLK